jgi:ABC-2 type transport system ATP-binding protein
LEDWRVHDGSGRITVRELSKNFGPVNAVSGLDFTVEPGSVTGFLGPNGSGKTTTLRMILGLVRPSAGSALVNGVPFGQLPNPAEVVGAALEMQGFHPARTARHHLRCYAAAIGVPDSQADQVLELVGLSGAADRRTGGYSLGMHQRLALATALLGDPQILVLDEPANGLDPEGIAWLRNFLKTFASTGRTVLVSSHLLREMEHTVDHAVIVSQGQCVYNGHLDELRSQQRSRVLVESDDPDSLISELRGENYEVEHLEGGGLAVLAADSRKVAEVALRAGVAVHGLQEEQLDLEQLFFQLTSGEHASGAQREQQPATETATEPAEEPVAEPAEGSSGSDSAWNERSEGGLGGNQ